jgi:hypothetical protein
MLPTSLIVINLDFGGDCSTPLEAIREYDKVNVYIGITEGDIQGRKRGIAYCHNKALCWVYYKS